MKKSTAVVTGASRGIGKMLVKHYYDKGYDVVGLYKNNEPDNNYASYYKVDVSNFNETQALLDSIKHEFHNVILVNSAGISYNSLSHKADMDKWCEVIDVNLSGLFNIIRIILPIMRNEEYGRIINISSVVAQTGVVGTSAYAASKAGLWGLAKAVAVENALKNITINNINLGYFDIGMIDQVPVNYLQEIVNKIPAKRLGNPDEIISAVEFISSNAYLNGTSIDLNGGMF